LGSIRRPSVCPSGFRWFPLAQTVR
jgi:hypothetical protein